MRKKLKKATVVLLVLIMVLSQCLTVFGGSVEEPKQNSSIIDSGMRQIIDEKFGKSINPEVTTNPRTEVRDKLDSERSANEEITIQEEGSSENSREINDTEIVPGKVLVKYKDGTSDRMLNSMSASISAVVSKKISRLGITQLELSDGMDVDSAIETLESDPNVEYVEPVYVRRAFGISEAESNSVVESVYGDDPFYTKGWQWGLEAINLEDMWKAVTEEERFQVTIAIVDTGVDVDHEDLRDSIVPGYDFINNDSDADDDCGHGTHVAGIAAAAHDGMGMTGVAGGVNIMPVKVLDETGSGDTITVINGILYAVNNGADVINLSLGSDSPSKAEEEAINYALGRGVTVVAAAGNDYGSPVGYPAAYGGVIAVGAVDWDGTAGEFLMADFSNAGPELDILAPGVDILSTIPKELDNPGNRMLGNMGDAAGDGYTLADGTSMAAPFAAGMAALLKAKNPAWNCDQILTEMQNRAEPFSGLTYYDELGEEVSVDSYILNSGTGSKPSLSFRRAVLYRTYSDSNVTSEFNLSFEDGKNTVTDAVYGTFDLMRREYTYLNGFQWTTEPQVADEIVIEKGQGSGTVSVDISALNKNYVFYVEETDGYMGSSTVSVIRDSSNTFGEARELQFNVESNASIDYAGDKDYFKFTVEKAGYYVIESTGNIRTNGYLYDSGRNILANDSGTNFRIDEDKLLNRLVLAPGTYYVMVRGFELGSYGVIVKEPATVSGSIVLPSGNATGNIDVKVSLITRTWNPIREVYKYNYVDYDDVMIPIGQSSVSFAIPAEAGIDYKVEYFIRSGGTNYLPVGYSGISGTVRSYNDAKVVAAGARNVNLTLIPSNTVQGDVSNVPYNEDSADLGVFKSGVMEYGEDTDWYKLTVTEPGLYMIGVGSSYEVEDSPYVGSIIDRYENPLDSNIVDNVYSFNDSEVFEYVTLDLTAGEYWFEVHEGGILFDPYEYKVFADKASVITGMVSLPGGKTLPYDEDIDVFADNSQGMSFVRFTYIMGGWNSKAYDLTVPASSGYTLGYYYYGGGYLDQAYYSASGTKYDKELATPVGALNNVGNINMELIPIPEGTDLEGDVKGEAVSISIGTTVEGRTNGEADVDYYKFTVPQDGYYNIETQSDEAISVYLYDNSDWILYNDGRESLTDGYLNAGTYYLAIRSYEYYGDYSFIVKNVHKPVATNVGISGTARVGNTLTGRYTYSDSDNDVEAGSTYRWLRSDSANGTYAAIVGATAKTYILTQSDLGKYVKFEVTPKAVDEPATGTAATSGAVGPIQAAIVDDGNNGNNGGSGSHGGGGGSTGGAGGTSTVVDNNTTYEQTKSGTAAIKKENDGRFTVDVKVDTTKVGSALTAAGKTPVIIDVKTKANQDKLSVNIPSDIFSKAAEKQKPVVVNSNNVAFAIDPGTFKAESLNGDVKLVVSQLGADSIKDIIKSKDASANEVSLVFDFDLSIGNTKITEFNKPITITVKYDASKVTDFNKVGVYYYNEKNGAWEYVGGKANPDGTITFTVEHFSKYIAMEYKKTFDDIKNHWAKKDIEFLIAKHIARSENETSFAPDSNITRAAFASMIVKALDIKALNTGKTFADIPINAWYKDDVYKAYAAGIIGGVNSKDFAPNELITREQMATMLMRAYAYTTGKKLEEIVTTMQVRFTDESSIESWARRNVTLANATGLITGNPDGTYNPKGNTTKAQAVVVIKRLMEKLNRF